MNGEGHPRSTARIGGHPIHPMLIPFPIVCFILTFVCDIFYVRGNTGLAGASNWLLIIGLVMLFARQMNSHISARATGSSGHKPVGSKAKADAAPARNA